MTTPDGRTDAASRRAGPDQDPQAAVARTRANVMGGRGPGADRRETARFQRERPRLGSLPAPLERERVHLQTAQTRSGTPPGDDPTALATRLDRWREVWISTQNGRSEDAAAEPSPDGTAAPPRPAPPRPAPPPGRPLRALLTGALTGAVIELFRRHRRAVRRARRNRS